MNRMCKMYNLIWFVACIAVSTIEIAGALDAQRTVKKPKVTRDHSLAAGRVLNPGLRAVAKVVKKHDGADAKGLFGAFMGDLGRCGVNHTIRLVTFHEEDHLHNAVVIMHDPCMAPMITCVGSGLKHGALWLVQHAALTGKGYTGFVMDKVRFPVYDRAYSPKLIDDIRQLAAYEAPKVALDAPPISAAQQAVRVAAESISS